ncbi:hypothetical protein [Arcticibacterium luteifluviistationis]|uniref:Uncharacterized protein n=1 Tax=Arcticibacterium luteifluviistationis TaxID=1784714 RepID=A0A2Z4GCA3_9BACT|nr:hypothetical protein [Arcticibacterium luteifluviistationis]AWV98767.1 hypothetical protein DJ013_11515 [Arcticibacterium luteifluviistationis]
MKKIVLLFTFIFISSLGFAQFGEVKPGTIQIYEPAGLGGLIKPNVTFSKIDFPDIQLIGYNSDDASIASLAILHTGGSKFTKFFKDGNIGIGYGLFDNFNDTGLGVRYFSSAANPHARLINLNNTEPARLNFENVGATGVSWQLKGKSNNTNTSSFFNINSSQGGDILTLRGDGKVGILTDNPSVPLHVNSSASSINSTTGAMILGTLAAGHLTLDNDEINAYNNTSGSTLYLNQESTGRVEIGGSSDLRVNGFTELGGSGAPSIKMKKLLGTSGLANSTVNVAHGLSKDKILGVQVILKRSENYSELPNFTSIIGYEYQVEITPTDISIMTTSSNSANILSKPFTVLITYEE